MLTVALQTDKSVPGDASEVAAAIYKKDVMTFLRSKYSRMKGFVLLDGSGTSLTWHPSARTGTHFVGIMGRIKAWAGPH
jgi:hypothetical protein